MTATNCLDLKERGNALYAQHKYTEALQAYDDALSTLPEAGSSELRTTILANRAACHLALKQWDACVQDTNEVLTVDGTRIKALYRRAQAHEGLGNLDSALQDLMLAVRLEPSNQQAVVAARRMREAAQRQRAEKHSPMAQLLERLQGPSEDTPSEGSSKEGIWKALIGLVAEDAAAALDLHRQGGLGLLWTHVHGKDATQRRWALVLLVACCKHSTFVHQALLSGSDSSSPDQLPCHALSQLLSPERKEPVDEGTAFAIITMFTRLVEVWKGRGPFVSSALDCWTLALSHPQAAVQEAGLEALTWRRSMCTGKTETVGCDETQMARVVRFFNDPDQAAAVAQQLQLKAAHVLGQEWAELRNEEGGEERAEAQVRELLATMATTVQGMEQRLVMTIGLFDTEPALGCVALEEEATQAAVRALLAAAPTPTAQMWVAELFNKAASTEVGRLRLGSYVEDQSIVRLLQEESALPEVRVAAASAFTKLGLAAKALPAASQELATLFNIAADVLQRSTAAGAVERAVEVLSSLVTRTAFKQEITFGSGRCKACLPLVLALVPEREQQEGKGTANHFQKAWYGVSFILASLALSNDELRKEALREKGVAPEEYEQLQKVQEMQQKQQAVAGAEAGGGPHDDPQDPPEHVQSRVRELVRLKGIGALCRLATAKGASLLLQEQVATAFVQVAAVPELRGHLVQDGGYTACLEMAKEGGRELEVVRTKALHALAKCLVTTDPKVLSERQRMAPIGGLLWLCRHAKATNLQQFEALLAITNLGSWGNACVDAIVANGGVSCLQALQYSDHPLVRRGATEALCNMACHPQVLEGLGRPDKLKIWLAFADDYEADLPTARAAAGTLAMASRDEGVAKALADKAVGALAVWKSLLQSGKPDLVHRAAVTIRNLLGVDEAMRGDGELLAVLKEAAEEDGKNGLSDDIRTILRATLQDVSTAPPK